MGESGENIRVVCQYQLFERKKEEKPLLLLGVIDISPDQDLKVPIKFQLINYKTGAIVHIPLLESTDISLTKRETEILRLVDKGMLSKDISNKLFISIHTVNRTSTKYLRKNESRQPAGSHLLYTKLRIVTLKKFRNMPVSSGRSTNAFLNTGTKVATAYRHTHIHSSMPPLRLLSYTSPERRHKPGKLPLS